MFLQVGILIYIFGSKILEENWKGVLEFAVAGYIRTGPPLRLGLDGSPDLARVVLFSFRLRRADTGWLPFYYTDTLVVFSVILLIQFVSA